MTKFSLKFPLKFSVKFPLKFSVKFFAALAFLGLFSPLALAQAASGFSSPDANVRCWNWEGEDSLQCVILSQDWSKESTMVLPRDFESCDQMESYMGLVLPDGEGEVGLVCHQPEILDMPEMADVLAEGERFTHGEAIECMAEAEAVRCENVDGHGVVLSRAQYELF